MIKIDIDPKKELFKWGPIDFKVVYPSVFIEAILIKIGKYYSWFWPASLTLFQNGKMVWINEYLALQKAGLKYFKKYFLNLKNYQKHWQKWEKWVDEYKKTAAKLNDLNLKKLSDKELYQQFKSFYDFNLNFWLIVHVPEIANWGGEYLLNKKLKDLYQEQADNYLEILSAPVKFSFFQQEELDLLRLAFIKNKSDFCQALKKHAQNYYWILNSYNGNRILTAGYFEKKLRELIKDKSAKEKIQEIKNTVNANKKRKEKLAKKLKLNKELVFMAKQLSQSIWWQDLRKGYIWRMNYYLDRFLKEISHRKNWEFPELQWCRPGELLDIISDRRVSKREILNRKKYYGFYAKEGRLKEFTDKKIIKKLVDRYLKIDTKGIEEIKGLVVSRGKEKRIQGTVKIISDPFRDLRKMKQGDILVAGMTSPEYIVAMRKAGAIITDHGGMTSHAAIVSRELKVSCIVGTKIATKVLKDGDLVEVDATEGTVKVLAKKSIER